MKNTNALDEPVAQSIIDVASAFDLTGKEAAEKVALLLQRVKADAVPLVEALYQTTDDIPGKNIEDVVVTLLRMAIQVYVTRRLSIRKSVEAAVEALRDATDIVRTGKVTVRVDFGRSAGGFGS